MIEVIFHYAKDVRRYKDYRAISITLISDSCYSDYKRLMQWCRKNNILCDAQPAGPRFIDISIDEKDKDIFIDAMNRIVRLRRLGLYETYDIIF